MYCSKHVFCKSHWWTTQYIFDCWMQSFEVLKTVIIKKKRNEWYWRPKVKSIFLQFPLHISTTVLLPRYGSNSRTDLQQVWCLIMPRPLYWGNHTQCCIQPFEVSSSLWSIRNLRLRTLTFSFRCTQVWNYIVIMKILTLKSSALLSWRNM